jgi:hypothetical protein
MAVRAAPAMLATPNTTPGTFDLRAHFERIFGVDLTAIPGFDVLRVQTIFSELGRRSIGFSNACQFCILAEPVSQRRNQCRKGRFVARRSKRKIASLRFFVCAAKERDLLIEAQPALLENGGECRFNRLSSISKSLASGKH